MPTRRETKAQLEQILASKTFGGASKLGPLLRYLVRCDLDEQSVDEYTLGREVFGKPKDWIPMHEAAVRQSFGNLRIRLATYFEVEGKDNSVVIKFPKRNGYQPRYTYNSTSGALEAVRRALYRREHEFPDLTCAGSIAALLEGCIEAHPAYAPTYVALAETLLTYVMCDKTFAFPARQSVNRAEEAITVSLQLDAQSWRAHVVAGAVHCCRFAWDKATAAFETALGLDPDETRAHLWYAEFLMAVGRVEEMKQCVWWREKRTPESRFTSQIRPLFLYVLRDFRQAYDNLALQSPFFADISSRFAYHCGDEIVPFDDWPVELLMTCLTLAQNQSRAAVRYAVAGVAHSKAGAFNGLVVLARAELGKAREDMKEKAVAFLDDLEDDLSSQSPMSLALAYMGVGKTEKAIGKLEEAMNDGHPLMAWLHLWPVFDPLREHESFKRLIMRMNLAT